jgi:hypothetical protein
VQFLGRDKSPPATEGRVKVIPSSEESENKKKMKISLYRIINLLSNKNSPFGV